MLPVFVSLSGGRLQSLLLLLFLIGSCLPASAQMHSIAFGLGANQTIPFGKVLGDATPSFQNTINKPGLSGSVFYDYQLPNSIIGLETGLRLCRSTYALKQTSTNAGYLVATTLKPDYLAISLPVQAIITFGKSPLDLYRFSQWAVVVGPHLNRIKETGLGLRSQFQGNGRVQTKLTNTFSFNSYWGWGFGVGVRFQQPLSRNRFLNYRLDLANTFNGIRPWRATLETNGQIQSIEIPRQPLPVLTLQIAYGFGRKDKRLGKQ